MQIWLNCRLRYYGQFHLYQNVHTNNRHPMSTHDPVSYLHRPQHHGYSLGTHRSVWFCYKYPGPRCRHRLHLHHHRYDPWSKPSNDPMPNLQPCSEQTSQQIAQQIPFPDESPCAPALPPRHRRHSGCPALHSPNRSILRMKNSPNLLHLPPLLRSNHFPPQFLRSISSLQ